MPAVIEAAINSRTWMKTNEMDLVLVSDKLFRRKPFIENHEFV